MNLLDSNVCIYEHCSKALSILDEDTGEEKSLQAHIAEVIRKYPSTSNLADIRAPTSTASRPLSVDQPISPIRRGPVKFVLSFSDNPTRPIESRVTREETPPDQKGLISLMRKFMKSKPVINADLVVEQWPAGAADARRRVVRKLSYSKQVTRPATRRVPPAVRTTMLAAQSNAKPPSPKTPTSKSPAPVPVQVVLPMRKSSRSSTNLSRLSSSTSQASLCSVASNVSTTSAMTTSTACCNTTQALSGVRKSSRSERSSTDTQLSAGSASRPASITKSTSGSAECPTDNEALKPMYRVTRLVGEHGIELTIVRDSSGKVKQVGRFDTNLRLK